jgi:hypothetical protein
LELKLNYVATINFDNKEYKIKLASSDGITYAIRNSSAIRVTHTIHIKSSDEVTSFEASQIKKINGEFYWSDGSHCEVRMPNCKIDEDQ